MIVLARLVEDKKKNWGQTPKMSLKKEKRRQFYKKSEAHKKGEAIVPTMMKLP